MGRRSGPSPVHPAPLLSLSASAHAPGSSGSGLLMPRIGASLAAGGLPRGPGLLHGSLCTSPASRSSGRTGLQQVFAFPGHASPDGGACKSQERGSSRLEASLVPIEQSLGASLSGPAPPPDAALPGAPSGARGGGGGVADSAASAAASDPIRWQGPRLASACTGAASVFAHAISPGAGAAADATELCDPARAGSWFEGPTPRAPALADAGEPPRSSLRGEGAAPQLPSAPKCGSPLGKPRSCAPAPGPAPPAAQPMPGPGSG
mmetsp:Transcript_94688/g.305682  ORF Transcript_94688/g.305682 Transcript_94688/m.305682 type:complete len:263 (+) Transcript_94688:818-1606(+)